MKATGLVRKTDHLGRFVLPVELRRSLDIEPGDGLAFFVDDDRIILHKHELVCVFCGSAEGAITYEGKIVCLKCLAIIAAKLNDLEQATSDQDERKMCVAPSGLVTGRNLL